MSATPDGQDVAMADVNGEITNKHSETVAQEGNLSDHVTNGYHSSGHNTTRSDESSDNEARPLNGVSSNNTRSAKSISSEESSKHSSRACTDEKMLNSPANERPRTETRIIPPAKSPSKPFKAIPISSLTSGPAPSGPAKPIESAAESIRFGKEVARLKEVLHETSGAAAQQVLRDEWRSLLFFEGSSEDHLSFFLRAVLKNWKESPRTIASILNHDATLNEILENPAAAKKILSSVTHTQLLKNVPTAVLDKALAERLKNVEAISLVRWLAEANRLGYKSDDILEDDEYVTPNPATGAGSEDEREVFEVEAPRPQLNLPPPPVLPLPAQRDPLLMEQERKQAQLKEAALQRNQVPPGGHFGPCPDCNAVFPSLSGQSYHVGKKLCTKLPPDGGWKFFCTNCAQGFTQKGGWNYHKEKGVCSSENMVPTNPSSSYPQRATHRPHGSQFSSPATPNQPQPQYHSAVRPPLHNQPSAPAVSGPIPSHNGPPAPAPLSRPPINTPSQPSPATPASLPKGVRRFEEELSPTERANLKAELDDCQQKYDENVADIRATYKDNELELQQKLTTAKNGFNTKKSQIRAKHGVTMRMRQADKDKRKAAGVRTPSRQSGEPSKMTASTPRVVTPPITSFSPVNGSGSGSKKGPGPGPSVNPPRIPPMLPTAAQSSSYVPTFNAVPYTGPPSNAAVRAPTAYTTSHPDIPTHAKPDASVPSGFGVMKVSPDGNPASYQTSHKRRRSQDEHGSPRPNGPVRPQPWFADTAKRTVSSPQTGGGGGLAMMEMRSEDAASKYKSTKQHIASSQTNVTAARPSSSGRPNSSGTGTKESVIVLSDSSESETDPEAVHPRGPAPTSVPANVVVSPIPTTVLAPSIENDDEMENADDGRKPERESESESEEEHPSPRPVGMKAIRSGGS